MRPNMPAHLYGTLKERLQNGDKQEAIELYFELLSSGHSVGEILSAVGALRNNSEQDCSAILKGSQSTVDGATTERASAIGLSGAAKANVQDGHGLSLFGDSEIRRPEKHEAIESAPHNEPAPNGREQLLPESLTGAGPDIAGPAETHVSTGREIALH